MAPGKETCATLQITVEHCEPDQMPEPEDLDSFKNKMAEFSTPIMLWQDEPLPEMKQWLEEAGVRIVVLEPAVSQWFSSTL